MIDRRERALFVEDWGAERVLIADDAGVGLRAVIAIDDTTLGPALGGIRMASYDSEAAAVAEARRLARAMTLKNAVANIGFGGGKTVVVAPELSEIDRDAIFLALGALIGRLQGVYIPAADMGTSGTDVETVGRAGVDVTGCAGDTGGSTAVGVHAAIAHVVDELGLATSLSGVRVSVQGVGKVGARLACLVAADGASLTIADVDPKRAAMVAAQTGASVVDPDALLSRPCDVFAPCAAAGIINAETVGELACDAIIGAANETLADPRLAIELARSEIVYVPDFVTSAGGVIHVRGARSGWTEARLRAELELVGERCGRLISEARRLGETPLVVAGRWVAAAREGRSTVGVA